MTMHTAMHAWEQKPRHTPVAMQEDHGGGQAAPVVQDELQVRHGLVALVDQRPVLCALCLVPVVHLVHDVRDLREVDVQPGRILHANTSVADGAAVLFGILALDESHAEGNFWISGSA